ncbi:MAG: hypothetical protein AAGG75_03805 [Bacteroidota bacterium]
MKMRTKIKDLRDLKTLNNNAKIKLKGGKGFTTGEGHSAPPPPTGDN